MVNMAGREPAGGAERRFMDVVKENIKLVGVRRGGHRRYSEMEAGDWLCPPLKERAHRKRGLSRANYKLSFDRKSPQVSGEVHLMAPLTFTPFRTDSKPPAKCLLKNK